jgi:predicted nucleotidyltransferase
VSPAIDAEREALLKALVDHGVQFVVIGGAGIQSHGRRYDTLDIDLSLTVTRQTCAGSLMR